MTTEGKVIEFFCIIDGFCVNFVSECTKNHVSEDNGHCHSNHKGQLSEIMTILVCYHFGSFANSNIATSLISGGIFPAAVPN